MKILIVLFITSTLTLSLLAQNEIEIRTDGIVIPRTTTSAVTNPVEGILIYDTTSVSFQYYNGSSWSAIGGSGNGGAFERVDGVVRQSSPKSSSDDFIFGLDSLPMNGSGEVDYYFFFNQTKGAFRGGTVTDNTWGQDSLGRRSFAYGLNTKATGDYSLAFGNRSEALEDHALAFGNRSMALSEGSVAFNRSVSSGMHAVSFNDGDARGEYSASFGESGSARGRNAASFGFDCGAYGEASFATGTITFADGISSATFGSYASAFGENSFAAGEKTRSTGQNCAVFGQYNDGIVDENAVVMATSPLLIVGNGDDVNSRNNALVIKKSGEVSFDNYSFPIDDGSANQVLSSNGMGQLEWKTESDNSPINELQTISKTGNLIILSDGGSIIDEVNDADFSPTNELQSVTKSGNVVTLSNGGGSFSVEDYWSNTGSNIYYNSGKVGVGEITPSGHLHITANDNINEPHLELTDQGSDAFIRIVMNRQGINKNWFNSATTHDTDDAQSFYSFIYEDQSGNLTEAIRMDGLGHVGIAGFPGTQELKVEGNASKTTAGDWLANSDRRIKTDIKEIHNPFEKILQLRPVKFRYSDEWQRRHPKIQDHYYYNFIAQEYQQVFPESVQGSGEYLENDPNEILQIDTYNAQIITIAAVQELIQANEELKNRIAKLELMVTEFSDVNSSNINE